MFSRSTVIICIGSEKITGDSLAPTVGDILTRDYDFKGFVYGTTAASVNGGDYEKWLAFIRRAHAGCKLIAVDAALGKEVGKISVVEGGVRPKASVGEAAAAVGDVGILAAVAPADGSPLQALMSVSAVDVLELARKVAFVLYCALSSASPFLPLST